MTQYIRRVAEWGIRPDTPVDIAHHYRLTNVLLLSMFVASFFMTPICFVIGASQAGQVNLAAPFVFGGGLLLMRLGRPNLARLFVLGAGFAATYAMVASLGPESYFQFVFLFASGFAFAFFSTEEKFLLAFGLLAPLGCFIALELTHYEPVFGMTRPEFNDSNTLVIRIASSAVTWFLMVFYFLYFNRDRRKAQERLVSSAKMAALGRMAAGIAHEINNPLQIIVAHADRMKRIMESGEGPSEKILDGLNQIQSVAMRIASINKGLLALSRNTASDPLVPVPVRSILKLALEFCQAHWESRQIELRLGVIPSGLTVVGRETQLTEVLLNILDNAYDAVSESRSKWIQIDIVTEREHVELIVTDSGSGVDPAILHRIFDPFFTTKPVGQGTGLGLSVSHAIMAAHGGQIFYDAKSGQSRFVIRAPRGPDRSVKEMGGADLSTDTANVRRV